MAVDNEWDDIITKGHTKSFPAVGYRQPPPNGKKHRKRSKGTIAMAVVTLIFVSVAIALGAVFAANKINLASKEKEYTSMQEEYNKLVEENAKIAAEIEEKKAEINNLQSQIQAMN